MQNLMQFLALRRKSASRYFHVVVTALLGGFIGLVGEKQAFADTPASRLVTGSAKSAQSIKPLPRAVSDRPDDAAGYHIHIMYVLPSDGKDQHLDSNGKISVSVAAAQKWFETQTGNTRSIRFDMHRGRLDVTFFRLHRTDREIASHGAYVRDEIEIELKAAKFDESRKIYLVYYGGRSTEACGGAAQPPEFPGKVAVLYLKGTPPKAPTCSSNEFAKSNLDTGYWEFSLLHEIFHMLGAVAACAPHHASTRTGHVWDDNRDLMYGGDLAWNPLVLDAGNDDYFGHKNQGCLDIAKSFYIDPVTPGSEVLPK